MGSSFSVDRKSSSPMTTSTKIAPMLLYGMRQNDGARQPIGAIYRLNLLIQRTNVKHSCYEHSVSMTLNYMLLAA